MTKYIKMLAPETCAIALAYASVASGRLVWNPLDWRPGEVFGFVIFLMMFVPIAWLIEDLAVAAGASRQGEKP